MVTCSNVMLLSREAKTTTRAILLSLCLYARNIVAIMTVTNSVMNVNRSPTAQKGIT